MNEGRPQVNGWLKLEVSRDAMEANLSIVPPTTKEGSWPDLAQAKQLIRQEVVTYGLMNEQVEQVINQRITSPTVIARGAPPVQGEDATIEFLFPTERLSSLPKEGEDGRVDFRETSVIHNIRKDEVLAVKTMATKGTLGRDVHSREVEPKPGKDKSLVLGRNVAWSGDGLQLIATADGEPTLLGNRISVLSVHEVPGGVNFRSGNIDFLGNVIIRGNVESGFTVKAEGDITVSGTVEAAMIYCGGSLTVMGGIIGQDKTEIKCGGHLTAYYVERSNLEVGGDIKVRDAIMHSRVSAGGSIFLTGRKGLLVGGLCRASDQVELQVLGSRLGTATEIEVGVNPGIRAELIRVEEDLKKGLDNIDKSSKILNLLERENSSAPERVQMRERISMTVVALAQENAIFEKRRLELIDEIQSRNQDRGRIKVRDTIFPGVRVTIGKATMAIRDEVRFATLSYGGGEIVIQSYR